MLSSQVDSHELDKFPVSDGAAAADSQVFMWRNQIANYLEARITSISHPTVSEILLVLKTFTYKLRKVPAEKFPAP
jgi:hypothetical protein